MKTVLCLGLLTAAVSLTASASAQSYGSNSASSSTGAATPQSFGGYGGSSHGYHSSTFEEGVLRGAADLTRAGGEANYFHSLAAINLQEAKALALQNRQQRIANFFNARQVNRSARLASQSKPLAPEHYAAIARKQAPDRLGDHQYDRVGGRLHWPTALAGREFAAERAALDDAFATREPGDAGVGTSFHAYVQQVSTRMEAKLKTRIELHSPMEFIAARKFVSSLTYEARQPLLDVEGLATAE